MTPDAKAALTPAVSDLPPYKLLEALLTLEAPYQFDAGVMSVQTDRRWFATQPRGDPRAAILELRRWPGDTVLSFYVRARPDDAADIGSPPVPDSTFDPMREPIAGLREWRGVWETDQGQRPAVWLERDPLGETGHSLAALLLPGDAGLGAEAQASLLVELQAVFLRAQVRAPSWKVKVPILRERVILPPQVGDPPGDHDEQTAPWQVIQGADYSMGLPPGVRARRMDGSVPPPDAIPGGKLWLRGQFRDIDGTEVVIGDRERFGYLAEIESPTTEWKKGTLPPIPLPNAKPEAGETFPLLRDRTDAKTSRAERWSEPGFEGNWMVFRLGFQERGLEIGLPVVEGRLSPSLFWIPATYRGAEEAPAPPPIDPAERFGIRFERLTSATRREQPWTEGFLVAPGLRVGLPTDWWPSASLRATDGYPIRLVSTAGEHYGWVARFDEHELEGLKLDDPRWTDRAKPNANRAVRVASEANGTTVFLAREGHAFLFQAEELEGDAVEWWQRMLKSVQLTKPER